jgi:hypothetical protein
MSSSSEDSELISALQALAITSPKLVRSSTYAAPDDPTIDVKSWKMNEFKYYDVPSPFPTLARGLFSTKDKDKGQYRIVVRGYDKFFNIGEVPWTTVSGYPEYSRSFTKVNYSGPGWKSIRSLLTRCPLNRTDALSSLRRSLPRNFS